ncbi:MAG: ABC transporter permease, partial [Chloroflexi bacterium]
MTEQVQALPVDEASRRHGREGSPWVGLGAVLTKEMADHLTSARMRI